MSKAKDQTYVTKIDPRLKPDRGPLQVLSSPKAAPEPEAELEAEP